LAVVEGFPCLALDGVVEIAVIVRVVFFVCGHVVPLCYGGLDLWADVPREDIPVAKEDVVLLLCKKVATMVKIW
jgi:hypothetical protein